jgi:hypothetical protein
MWMKNDEDEREELGIFLGLNLGNLRRLGKTFLRS